MLLTRLCWYCVSLAIVLDGFAAQSLAALDWSAKESSQVAGIGDTSATAKFPFKNAGDSPITILSTATSCGCTVATLAKKTFEPGEKGEIQVTFNIGSRTGGQVQTVTVRTDDKDSDAELKLAVTIPKLYTLTPTLLFWRMGEQLTAKESVLKIDANQGAKLLSVTSSDPRVLVKSETVRDGKEYKIIVTPGDKVGSEMVKSIITVQTDLPAGTKASTHIYAFIKR